MSIGTRTISFALAFLLAGVFPAVGEETSGDSPKPVEKVEVKERALADLVEALLKEGHDASIGKSSAGNLGLERRKTPAKAFMYDTNISPDGRRHSMKLVYSKDEGGNLKPESIVWQISKYWTDKKGEHIESRGFRASLDGTLLNALKIKGLAYKTKHKRLSIKSRRVKKAFQKELTFWLKDMAHIEYEK